MRQPNWIRFIGILAECVDKPLSTGESAKHSELKEKDHNLNKKKAKRAVQAVPKPIYIVQIYYILPQFGNY